MKKLFLALLAVVPPLAQASENLIGDVLAPKEGAPSELIIWSDLRTGELSVEGDAYLLSNLGSDDHELLRFRTKALPPFGNESAYIFSVEVNIRSMERLDPNARRKHPPQGFMLYFHQEGGNAHRWAAITGNVSDTGWIKISIPIDLVEAPQLAKAFVLATIREAKAEIEIRNFSLEVYDGTGDSGVRFMMPDGTVVAEGPLLRL